MKFAYSTLACPGRRLEETLELGARTGYAGVELRLALVPSPWVGAVWDSHHPGRAGESAREVYEAIGSRLCLAQVKDAARTGNGPNDWRLVLLGEGDVPVRDMLRLLVSGGYTGWVSVEWEKRWHPEIEEPELALPQHLELLRSWMAELDAANSRPEGR